MFYFSVKKKNIENINPQNITINKEVKNKTSNNREIDDRHRK